ncbi:MAG: cytochrome c [Pseudomonadales bacterium]|nr:cytochrome c [Pseudomonadales bacterium]
MKKVIVLALALVFSQQLLADAASEIAYRKAVMEVVGGHMKSIGTILRGKVHMEDLKFHANGMKNVSVLVPNVFPEGSGEGKTEALPEIWEDAEDFQARLDEFLQASDEFAGVVNAGEMAKLGDAVKRLGGSCKGCHDSYKEDD